MAIEPEDVLRRSGGGGGGSSGIGGAVVHRLSGHARRGQQPLQQPTWKAELGDMHMPRALRLQAVCGAVSCVDESPTAAASPGVSLLRSSKDGAAEPGVNEATSPHRKRRWFRQPGTLSRSLSRQPSRSGTDPNDGVRLDATSGESPTPSPGCVPCARRRNGNETRGSSVPVMTAVQAAGTAAGPAAGHLASAGAGPAQSLAAAGPGGGDGGASAAADAQPLQHGAAAASAAAAAPSHAAPQHEAPPAQRTAPGYNPNDLAALNARLAAGLASLPPPPPHSGSPSGSSGGGGGDGSSQRDGGSSGGCRKRQRAQGVLRDSCRLRGGDAGGTSSEPHAAGCHGRDAADEGDSEPSPVPRPIKVQRIAVGMSTTDLPAVLAAALERDEGASLPRCPSGSGERHGAPEPALQLPAGRGRQRLPGVQVFNGFWGLDDARRNRDCLFVFGDNDARQGFAGQAVVRGEPNAVGLPTKRTPSHVAHAYYRDEDFEANAAKISAGIAHILHMLLDGYVPDADVHPGVRTTQGSPAAAGLAAGGGCAAAAAVAGGIAGPAAGEPQGSPEPPSTNQQQDGQQPQQQQARRLEYRALVVPSDGFGTGRARLHTDAPRTFAFLKRQVCQLLELLQPGSGEALDW